VRQRLGSVICQNLGKAGELHVLTLDPAVEQKLATSIRAVDEKSALVLEPRFAEQILGHIATQVESMMKNNLMPVLLCAPELRRHLRRITERVMPHLSIVSLTEVPTSVSLKAFAVVNV
jgi:flagellar biosynthesis protein FlhA